MHQTSEAPDRTPLGRLASVAFRRRRTVVLGWLVALVVATVASMQLGGDFVVSYDTPGSESQAATRTIDREFGGRSTDEVEIVWKDAAGADRPRATATIDGLLARTERLPGVGDGVTTKDAAVSRDGTTAVVRIPLTEDHQAVPESTGTALMDLASRASDDGVRTYASGGISGMEEEAGMSSEIAGFAVAAIVLLLTFGSAVAAGLPLVVALMGVGVALGVGGLLAAVVDTPDWAVQMALMLGVGVGIDYALIIITRFRTARAAGRAPHDATVEAMTTAGRSVLVAGGTVVVSLLGLYLMGLPYLHGVALASSASVLVVLAASLTLLPALLGFAGRRIERLRILGVRTEPRDPDGAPGARWARRVQRRPVLATVLSLALLALLAAPATTLRFGFPDAGNDATGTAKREAYDLVTAGFGPGQNGPLVAVAATPRGAADRPALERLASGLRADRGVASVGAPVANDRGTAALIQVVPRTSPQSTATKDLVERLRDGPLHRAGLQVDLGGATASAVDQGVATADRLPLFVGGVVLISFLLLVAAFRAPVVAAKAGVMNLLSIGAAFGVVGLVAQGGWAGQLVGIDTPLPVPPFIPVIMFAALFGLSMDYEVFLMSAIRERFARHGDAGAAVAEGVARTARVITAAAAIMVAVFAAFALSPEVFLKLMGLGLATAILVDATIVRMVLVPAVMQLLGARAWWSPRWLRDRRGRATSPVAAD
ncbi:MMPL family transporter [Patulibacter minatonensis]|uniref:MMPL family transporter n=1 Tax=Patulibacter minatonensis TaxID=298163 RepID=UPI0006884930|nr:MMPL family transporter [Patulibacter minatonensis]